LSTSGYRTLFRLPAVRRQAASGLLAQVIQGTASVGIILVLHEYGASLSLAGAVLAALWVSSAVARPIQGRLIDRHGPAELMVICAIVSGPSLAAIVWLSSAHGPGVALVALGALAGLALPPVSTSMRITWAGAAGDGERTAAYSLVYLIQELAILTGPLIFAGLVAVGSPAVALLAVIVIGTAGTLGFASCTRASPRHGSRSAERPQVAVLRLRSMQLLLLVAMLVGGVAGAIQVAAPTFAAARHAPAAAGLLIAAVSVGGIIGAAVYATGRWRISPSARLLVLVASLTASVALASVAVSLIALAALLVVVGLPLNPTFTTLSLLVDQHVPPGAAGEAFGLLSTGIAGGTGAGSAIAAALAQQHHDARIAFVVALVAGAAAAGVTLAARRSLRGESG
jgi:MFS family permease